MIDEEAPVQFIDAHRPFKLKKKHILDVRGVYDSNITLTEWNADMVVKIYAPAAGLDGQEVYAQHRDFTFVGKFKVENQRMYMIEDKAQIQLVKGGTSFVLSRDEVVKIIGVFSLANFFTDWKADTVIKVFARNHELDGEDVYAKFSDYRIVCNDSSKDNSNNQDN